MIASRLTRKSGTATPVNMKCMNEISSELVKFASPNSLTKIQMAGAQPASFIQPMNSIPELDVYGPSRTCLKLSRIISRRGQDTLLAKSMQQAELMPNGANMPNMPGSPFIKYENGKTKEMLKSMIRKVNVENTRYEVFRWYEVFRKKEIKPAPNFC